MRRIVLASALVVALTNFASGAPADDWLDELRHSFTVEHKPVPPQIFADLGDGDSGKSIRVTIDLLAAIESKPYSKGISTVANGWVIQDNVAVGLCCDHEQTSYKFVGASQSNLLVVLTAQKFAGSGNYYTLRFMDVVAAHAFDSKGKIYDRLNLTPVRDIPLGDRWKGTAKISGDDVTVVTEPGEPNNNNQYPVTNMFAVRYP